MSQNQSTKRLMKRIAVDLAVVVVVSAVLIGVALFISSMGEEEAKKADQLSNDINLKTGELQTLKAKIAQFKDAVPLRESLKDEKGKVKLDLSRDKATNIFLKLKDSYALKDIKISISPITAPKEPEFNKPNMQVIMSDIGITMKAYSDKQVLQFIHDVKKEFPGVVKIKKISMTRGSVKSLKDNIILDKEVSYSEPMLDVKIDMVWYGIQDVEVKKDASGAPVAPGAAP